MIGLRNERALRAVRSLDEGNISEAYLQGDIDLEGDMLQPFTLRESLDDMHPLVRAWRFIKPLLFGQVYTNKRAISSHYNADPNLFLSFLDPVFPAYSQGVYENNDEPLSKALQRKFDWALEQCRIGKGTRVLEIGLGWGAFAGHALQAGARFTGITNSEVSQTYLRGKLTNFGDNFDIELVDFYEFLNKMGKTDFEVEVIHNDRWSYYLIFKQWAMNLDAHKDYIQRTFGDFEFRKFRLYLWGATYEFLHRNLDCYRLILSKPKA